VTGKKGDAPVEKGRGDLSQPVQIKQKGEKPFSLQAQRLIDQVRVAIVNLSNSSNLTDPKGALLRKALKGLKPLLVEIVESIPQHDEGDLPAAEKRAARFAIYRSLREESFQKRIKPKSLHETESLQEIAEPSLSPEKKERPRPAQVPMDRAIQPKEEASPREAKIERTSLTAAPFVAQMRSLAAHRKGKKKRKGFWFREEEEKQNPPS